MEKGPALYSSMRDWKYRTPRYAGLEIPYSTVYVNREG